ncbi:glycoside hydrolase family protein [Millionella massiliensis]|uniref:hypothetical protein n=1 Tax=Millionella massiliensis TaxID=1871023 RepID=UPI00115FA0DE|nr:hypothetical protein [Millionella massiliensis]
MRHLIIALLCLLGGTLRAQTQFTIEAGGPAWKLDGRTLLSAPAEGLWSIATAWENDWPAQWVHATPTSRTQSGEWTILTATVRIHNGEMFLRDAYRELPNGLTQCIRRYQWNGPDTLRRATLSVRLAMEGEHLMPLLPGILYYGNPNGAQVNPNIIPVYGGNEGDFAIFEDHRYPQPFAMLESASGHYAAAVHTTPSPVRGAVLNDQWWSMGVENRGSQSEFVLLSGPIGYNGRHSVAKALQFSPMTYTDTYLNLEPGRVIEKEFFVELYPIDRPGTGFQRPLYHSIDLHKPFDADRFPSFDEILRTKYKFAQSRWMEGAAPGYNMYDSSMRRDIVMGWCGQADSPGFALQVLEGRLGNDPRIVDQVQRSLDFLTQSPMIGGGLFAVGYQTAEQRWYGGDPVSCGQAMYNFARAIEQARGDKRYDTRKWETFLQKVCDSVSARILAADWNPRSTAEAFFIAPLAIASELFRNTTYEKAAIRAGELFASRHLANASYWGGTLDATCEDKEGAWAAFQAFLELYERFGEARYLEWAKHAMDVCLSYVVVWDIPLPAGRMADHHFKTTGWTVVSPQNQHIDIYGVLFAPEVYRMGQILKNRSLQRLAEVMFRSCIQLTDPFGSQGEQLQQTNFAQHGDMSNVHKLRGGYSESWTVFWITAHFLNAAAKFELMGYPAQPHPGKEAVRTGRPHRAPRAAQTARATHAARYE